MNSDYINYFEGSLPTRACEVNALQTTFVSTTLLNNYFNTIDLK